jgi:DNA polymerase-3 subunit delta'
MKFSEVIGNEQAIEQIRRMIDNDRLPHALLLYGEPGVPKLGLAMAAAQYLHCKNHTDGDSCGVCPLCRQHQSFNQVDTHFSYPFTNRKGDSTSPCEANDYIDEWREFITNYPVEDYQAWLTLLKNDNAQPQIFVREADSIMRKMTLSAYTAKYKVLIMWLPEKLKDEAANKLLKLIEEPYDDCKFILVSDNEKGILGTILSRCQRIELRKPSTSVVAQYLADRYGMDMQNALALAAPADGNVIMADHLVQTGSEFHEFRERFIELMRLSYQRDLAKLKEWSEAIAEMKREKARRFLDYAVRQVRENFIYNLHNPALNYLTPEEEAFSTRFSPFINERNVEGIVAELQRAGVDIAGNGNAKIVLFDLSIRIAMLIRL